jgi:hypothetical protein
MKPGEKEKAGPMRFSCERPQAAGSAVAMRRRPLCRSGTYDQFEPGFFIHRHGEGFSCLPQRLEKEPLPIASAPARPGAIASFHRGLHAIIANSCHSQGPQYNRRRSGACIKPGKLACSSAQLQKLGCTGAGPALSDSPRDAGFQRALESWYDSIEGKT